MALLFAGVYRERARLRVHLRRVRLSVRLALLPVLSDRRGLPGWRVGKLPEEVA